MDLEINEIDRDRLIQPAFEFVNEQKGYKKFRIRAQYYLCEDQIERIAGIIRISDTGLANLLRKELEEYKAVKFMLTIVVETLDDITEALTLLRLNSLTISIYEDNKIEESVKLAEKQMLERLHIYLGKHLTEGINFVGLLYLKVSKQSRKKKNE